MQVAFVDFIVFELACGSGTILVTRMKLKSDTPGDFKERSAHLTCQVCLIPYVWPANCVE